MESESTGAADHESDLRATDLLGAIENAQASARGESLWPPNPLWHGPLLAAMIWGSLAFAWDRTTTAGLVGLSIAAIGFYVTGVQYWRRRRVRGVRPTGPMVRRLAFMYAYAGLISIAVIVGWGQTVYRFGAPRPGPVEIAVGLAISSVIVTIGVASTNVLSRCWLGRAE